jgi:hypothetical protein
LPLKKAAPESINSGAAFLITNEQGFAMLGDLKNVRQELKPY